MAHWNETRDREWVRMMRAVNRFPSLIDQFEKTGDLIYWDLFIKAMRQTKRATRITELPRGCASH